MAVAGAAQSAVLGMRPCKECAMDSRFRTAAAHFAVQVVEFLRLLLSTKQLASRATAGLALRRLCKVEAIASLDVNTTLRKHTGDRLDLAAEEGKCCPKAPTGLAD